MNARETWLMNHKKMRHYPRRDKDNREIIYKDFCPVCLQRKYESGICEECDNKYDRYTITRMFQFRRGRRKEDFGYYVTIYPEAEKYRNLYA
jgi:hypothetical protein